MQSEKDEIMELLTVTEVKEGGEVTFTDRSIEILQELGQQYKETPLFKKICLKIRTYCLIRLRK